ncbi:hypothetical protein [Paenibacillus tyrfis]|uniref:hypothetical protein n=1 Tax=Paenibacillus tyrfis TaxID=1501230 RepID=UPI000B58C198|nr:hypothetical protein [Paenibacillus tyrfis]
MGVTLISLHYAYLLFILLIIGFMVMRRDTTIVCITGIVLIGLLSTAYRKDADHGEAEQLGLQAAGVR